MASGERCKECGTTIPADSPGGFCAQCLLGLGLEPEEADQVPIPEVRSLKSKVQSHETEAAGSLTKKPGDRIGRYRLLEEIGHGGCGVVYMAEQEEPVRRKVALKVIKLGMDTRQVVARFEAERQALALMDHPNIAKVLDAGATDTGRPYFVMELVGGIKITDYCDQNQLTTRQRLDLFIQVCRALQHAHQKGIIHRDIKPSNVLVTTQDGVPVPKVIDFGIAKATQGRLTDQTLFTAFEQFLGTPAYMSPEQTQLGAVDVDTRSDIYSLGVLLYELMTGSTPFDTKELVAAGLDEMRRTIREVEPVKPSTRLTQERVACSATSGKSEIDKDLDWIVMRCLEKDRARRYETASGLARDIERHLNNEPVVARPPSAAYRFQKAFRRNKLAFTAAAAVTMALVAGIAVSTSQRRIADQAAEELRDNLYASEMSAAFGAYWAGSVQRSRDLLDQQSQADRAGRRGFEWRWLWGQTRPAEQSVHQVGDAFAIALDFSPDGHRFLTFGGSLKLWDTATHELVWSNRHNFGYHAEFSRDGRFIVSTDYGGREQRLWDATTGVLLTNLAGHRMARFFFGTSLRGNGSLSWSRPGRNSFTARDSRRMVGCWRQAVETATYCSGMYQHAR